MNELARSVVDVSSNADIVLKTRNVVLARNDKAFARLPDIDLAAGRAAAIVGPSGSGKTTALLALAGVRPPMEGTISIANVNPWQLGRSARDRFRGRRIGLVFQSFHLVDALSVAANVRLAAQCAGYPLHDPDRLDTLLARLGLKDARGQRADRISHGQAQRAAVARALLNKPILILADEPTSALDDGNTESLVKLLKESARLERAALLIVTHDRRVLPNVDQVFEMEAIA